MSARAVAGLVHGIAFAFAEKYRALLRETDTGDFRGSLQAPLRLLTSCVDTQPGIASSAEIRVFLPDIFSFAYLSEVSATARTIWRAALSNVHGDEREELIDSIKQMLRDLIVDTEVCVPCVSLFVYFKMLTTVITRPSSVVSVASNPSTGITFDLLRDLFPSQAELDGMLQALPSDPSDYSLAIVDRLIPPPSLWKMDQKPLQAFDKTGFSEYARIINTLLTIAISDRTLARDNMWLLPHFISLYLVAKDALSAPSDDLVLFDKHIAHQELKDIVTRVETLSAFLLSDVADDSWHSTVVQSLVKNDKTRIGDSLGHFVHGLMSSSNQKDSVRDSRILHFVVRHLLKGSSTSDADQWMLFARQMEKKGEYVADIRSSNADNPCQHR